MGTDNSYDIAGILEENAGIIHKLSFMYANSSEEAEDLRQEISYQVVKSYKKFRGDSKISTWVYKVALFTALTYLKKRKNLPNQLYLVPEIAEAPEEEDRWQEVLGVIKQLQPVDRSLVFLYLENKSYAEMAEIMGMTESNIGVRLNRIKQLLKDKVQ